MRNSYPCKQIICGWLDAKGQLSISTTTFDLWITADLFDEYKAPVVDLRMDIPIQGESCEDNEDAITEVSCEATFNKKLADIRNTLDMLKSWAFITSSGKVVDQVNAELSKLKQITKDAVPTQGSIIRLPKKLNAYKKRIQLSSGSIEPNKRRKLRNPYRHNDRVVKSLANCEASSVPSRLSRSQKVQLEYLQKLPIFLIVDCSKGSKNLPQK